MHKIKILFDTTHYIHIGIDDLLRDETKGNTLLGQQIKELVEKGDLMPNDLIFKIVRQKIYVTLKELKPIIIDGIIQSKEHIEFLNEFIIQKNLYRNVQYVYLETPEELARTRALDRLTCSHCNYSCPRSNNDDLMCLDCNKSLIKLFDDSSSTIEKRIQRFYKNIIPLIDIYTTKERFHKHSTVKPLDQLLHDYESLYISH